MSVQSTSSEKQKSKAYNYHMVMSLEENWSNGKVSAWLAQRTRRTRTRVFVTVENEQIHLMHAHNKFMFNSNYGYTNSIIIGTDNYIPFKR